MRISESISVNTRLAATLPRYARELTPNLVFTHFALTNSHAPPTRTDLVKHAGLITPFAGTLYENQIYSIVRVHGESC